jgi:hypothetical protein
MWLTLSIAAGLVGSVAFWLVQALAGGPTITAYMGEEIVRTGGYPSALGGPLGWAVHVAVSLSYALLFGGITYLLGSLPPPISGRLSLLAAIGLGWFTTVIAPPAISVAIGLLGGRGWPDELFPPNTGFGLPLVNHVLFFVLNRAAHVLGPRLARR